MQHIGVFLSANDGLPAAYAKAAEELGTWIGRTGRTLVYGGSSRGLMDVIGRAVKQHGGRTVGVVPQILYDKGWDAKDLDVSIPTADLTDRKVQLIEQSDVLVALPGGIGTLDELFTAIGIGAIGLAAKPVVIYNVEGCWDSLIKLIDDLSANRLLRPGARQLLSVADTFDGLTALLER
ncbi:MAG: TIGR00730 family Rossman fold protein [Alloprevotella sp.]|nr:TIGR00730 family Rossman fold protein [Alloprevotella sp.]